MKVGMHVLDPFTPSWWGVVGDADCVIETTFTHFVREKSLTSLSLIRGASLSAISGAITGLFSSHVGT